MTAPTPKTLQEHRAYLYEIVKLQLFFLHHWLVEHPDESVVEVLRNRIDIYRKSNCNSGALNPATCCWDSPEWQALENAVVRVYDENRSDASAFEQAAFALIQASLDARCERDYLDRSALSSYQCGCLRHNLEIGPKLNDLGFHIANSLAPDSFFAHPDYLIACFRKLLDVAENQFEATHISTGTWLNSVPKWLAYFPQEWLQNMGPANMDVKWHYGFWGQFISARGTFNHRYGQILRQTGKLPFYPLPSYCRISAMREKLDALEKGL